MEAVKRGLFVSVMAVIMLTFNLATLAPISHASEILPEQRNLTAGLDYEWSEEPHTDYPDSGNQLTDGVYGSLNVLDPAWVGHLHGKTREVVFDLGEKKSISSIQAHFLQDYPASAVLVPLTVSMYVSNDKENWGALSHNSTQLLWGGGPPREETYVWDGSQDGIPEMGSDKPMVYARYVKVTFSMHTTQWTFIDEIEIWGTDGKVEGAVVVPPKQPAYLAPGEATAGIHNLALLYNGYYDEGQGIWTKDRIIPYISYVNEDGEPVDWFFDGILYLGLMSPEGRSFETGTATQEDWDWYLDKTFAKQGDMQQLNEAAKEVGSQLDQPDHKVKVVLMIPYPGANGQQAIDWWLDQVQQRWNEGNYTNLELAGMYWLHEQIEPGNTGEDAVSYASEVVHEAGMKFFWIPHFLAYKSHRWDDVGIDAAAFQPNYFFQEMDVSRIEDAANIAKQYGMGIELEFDDRLLTDDHFRQKYIDYLNGGVKYGYMQNAFKAYYEGGGTLFKVATSQDPETRILYDWLYQFANGTYEEPATSSDGIKKHVDMFESQGEFIDDRVAHALKLHLTAVDHFEKQGATDKVLKHMASFKLLLDHQKETGSISGMAYNILRADADTVIAQWE